MATSNQPPRASGVYAALPTPRQADSVEADAAVLLDYLDAIVQAGVDGLVLFGSTGEFVHFDPGERSRVVSLAIRRSRVPVLVNVSHSTLPGAIELARDAVHAGASGLLLMPPFFYCYTAQQISAFYDAFVEELNGIAPLYLYNLPMYSNAIPADVADRLLSSGAFAGIKDSTVDWNAFEPLTALRARSDFSLVVGNEVLYLRGRRAGADGIVSGVAAALPELLVAMEGAIRESDFDRAGRFNDYLQEFVAWVNKFPATLAIKQAAAARGWPVAQFATPLDEATRQELAAFQRWLDDWLDGVLSQCTQARAMRS
jgi:dihydrodipicolinate synthase/N-acetylneuraminate lyase